MPDKLAPSEISELEKLELIIESTQDGFLEYVGALSKICTQRLYREDYETFQDYCAQKWDLTPRRIQQLVLADAVVQELPSEMRTIVRNEASARELSKVPKEQRAEVLTKASKNGKVTAKAIKLTAEQQAEKDIAEANQSPNPVDEMGFPIPAGLVDLYHRRQELQDLMTTLSNIKSQIKKGLDDNDPLYRALTNTLPGQIAVIRYSIGKYKPFSVCLDCNGHPKGCAFCCNTGFIGKEQFEDLASEETREKRMIAIRKLKVE